jgi:hypothetical protein
MSDGDILATPPEQHLHDLRAVYDMGNLRLRPGADAANHPWSVLRLLPDPHSGSETAIGIAQNIDTGQLVDVATGKPVPPGTPVKPGLIEEGSWKVISRIGVPRGKQSGRYKWTEPIDYRDRKLEPDDIYRPFGKGGVVLCRHNPKVEGEDQFNSVSLLPPGWESDVRPAFEALQKNKALSATTASSTDVASLRALPSNNSIVSSIAFRMLAESGNLDPATLQQKLPQTSDYLRAVVMYVALIHPPAATTSTLEPALTQAVQQTTQLSDSRAVVLASTAAVLFHPELSGSRELGLKLLNSVRSRPIPALAGEKSDPYVDQLLSLTHAS